MLTQTDRYSSREEKRRIKQQERFSKAIIRGLGIAAVSAAGILAYSALPLNDAQLKMRIDEGRDLIKSTTPQPAFSPGMITSDRFDAQLGRSLNCFRVSASLFHDDEEDKDGSFSMIYGIKVNGKPTPYTLPLSFVFAHCDPNEISTPAAQKKWARGLISQDVTFGPFDDAPGSYDTQLKPEVKKAFDAAAAAIETRQQVAIRYAVAELTKARHGKIEIEPEGGIPWSVTLDNTTSKALTIAHRLLWGPTPTSPPPAPR